MPDKKPPNKNNINLNEAIGWIRFNILPLFVFIFFIVMLFGYTIPRVRELVDKYSLINELNDELEGLEQDVAGVELIVQEREQNAQFLNRMERIVPTRSSRVVEFKNTIEDTAEESGLAITESRAGEIIRGDDESDNLFSDEESRDLVLIEIPIELSARGRIEDFRNFLNTLYSGQDFFVVREMEITKIGGAEVNAWEAEFQIVKYQFDGTIDIGDDIRAQIGLSPSEEVISFLENKFDTESIDEELDN